MRRATLGSASASWKSSITARNGAGAWSAASTAASGDLADGARGSRPRVLDQTATLASKVAAAARQISTARSSSAVTR